MADNFFRPGFTQGAWANGKVLKNLHYLGFVGNGLNTFNISAAKIDTHLLVSGSVWWEPFRIIPGTGKSRNMYDDFSSKESAFESVWDLKLARGPFLESRSIKSGEHVTV